MQTTYKAFRFKLWLSILLLFASLLKLAKSNTPLVVWHGMGDSCCNPASIGYIKSLIRSNISDIYIHSIQIGNNEIDDILNGFLMDTNEKIRLACSKIANDPQLKNGYNAMGFSQGSQFLRAVAQRCPYPPMLNLISIGGQHQGVYGVPFCSGFLCRLLNRLISFSAYFKAIQRNFVQASYWHDPLSEEIYKNYNSFLADINQEKMVNSFYKDNMMKLKSLVLVKFEKDEMVKPIESQWFGFYKKDSPNDIYTMEESPLYLNDTLGLKSLDKLGKIFKLSVNGGHLSFNSKWFIENIVIPFIKDK